MKADSSLIKWLLEEAMVTPYRIAKDTGISEMTLSKINNGVSKMENITFGTAAALTTYAEKKLEEDTRMNFRILETGEIKPLEIEDRNGIDWTADLLGNNGALNFNRETEEYELDTQEDYNWWKEYIENWMADEKEADYLAEELGIDPSDVHERIAKELIGYDMEMHHNVIQDTFDTLRVETPLYIIETEDPDKVARGDHGVREIHRTYSKEEAMDRFENMNFDKGLTLMISKLQNGVMELIEERTE